MNCLKHVLKMNAVTSKVVVEFYHLNMIIDLSHICIYTYRNASAFILQNTLFRNAYGNNKIQRQPKMTKKKVSYNWEQNKEQSPSSFNDGMCFSPHANYVFTLRATKIFPTS